jgi:hypothetical protein
MSKAGIRKPRISNPNIITQDRLKEVLHYCPKDGIFTWKVSKKSNKVAGKRAGSFDNRGYRVIRVDDRNYKEHRLAHLYMTGEWPLDQIDHKEGRRGDNRWEKIRPSSNSQNQANKRKRSNNSSGIVGVHWHKASKKWQAQISKDGKKIQLGIFSDPNEAKTVRDAAARELFGEFANVG